MIHFSWISQVREWEEETFWNACQTSICLSLSLSSFSVPFLYPRERRRRNGNNNNRNNAYETFDPSKKKKNFSIPCQQYNNSTFWNISNISSREKNVSFQNTIIILVIILTIIANGDDDSHYYFLLLTIFLHSSNIENFDTYQPFDILPIFPLMCTFFSLTFSSKHFFPSRWSFEWGSSHFSIPWTFHSILFLSF